MKQLAGLLINIILLLVFTNTLAIASTKFDDNDVTLQSSGTRFIEAVGRNQTITTSNTKTINVYNIAGYSTFAIHNVTASSENVTFLFESVDQTGTVVSTAAMTEGTDITNIDGANCNIKLINGAAIPITVTYSILIAD